MRKLTFRTADLRSATAFLTAIFDMHSDVVQSICLHRSDECGRRPVDVFLEGPRAEGAYDELLLALTQGLPVFGDER